MRYLKAVIRFTVREVQSPVFVTSDIKGPPATVWFAFFLFLIVHAILIFEMIEGVKIACRFNATHFVEKQIDYRTLLL